MPGTGSALRNHINFSSTSCMTLVKFNGTRSSPNINFNILLTHYERNTVEHFYSEYIFTANFHFRSWPTDLRSGQRTDSIQSQYGAYLPNWATHPTRGTPAKYYTNQHRLPTKLSWRWRRRRRNGYWTLHSLRKTGLTHHRKTILRTLQRDRFGQ